MPDRESDASARFQLLQGALSRWDNEGGAGPGRNVHPISMAPDVSFDVPPLTNAELVQLQIRVIALENVVMALLSEASGPQLELAREMAMYISPRPGHTPHHLTIRAAARMTSLVEGPAHLRALAPSSRSASAPADARDRRERSEPA